MKTIYYSIFLFIALSAASNNGGSQPPQFTRLKELHIFGAPFALGPLDIYPGKGLALLATLATIEKTIDEEQKQRQRLKQAHQHNKELILKLKNAKNINESLLATIEELREKNALLSSSSSHEQFSTPPSSPTEITTNSKHPTYNRLISIIISLFGLYSLSKCLI